MGAGGLDAAGQLAVGTGSYGWGRPGKWEVLGPSPLKVVEGLFAAPWCHWGSRGADVGALWAHLGELLLGRACLGTYQSQTPSASKKDSILLTSPSWVWAWPAQGGRVPWVGADLSGTACPTEHLGPDEMEHLLRSVCLLLGFRTRRVVKAVLGFLRAALLLLDDRLLAPHIPAVVSLACGDRAGLLQWEAGGGLPSQLSSWTALACSTS